MSASVAGDGGGGGETGNEIYYEKWPQVIEADKSQYL